MKSPPSFGGQRDAPTFGGMRDERELDDADAFGAKMNDMSASYIQPEQDDDSISMSKSMRSEEI